MALLVAKGVRLHPGAARALPVRNPDQEGQSEAGRRAICACSLSSRRSAVLVGGELAAALPLTTADRSALKPPHRCARFCFLYAIFSSLTQRGFLPSFFDEEYIGEEAPAWSGETGTGDQGLKCWFPRKNRQKGGPRAQNFLRPGVMSCHISSGEANVATCLRHHLT